MKQIFLERLSIKAKLAVTYFLVGFITLVIVSFILYSISKQAIIERTEDQLESINTLKKSAVENLFKFVVLSIQEDKSHNLFKRDQSPVHTKDSSLHVNKNHKAFLWKSLKIFSGYAIMDEVGNVLKSEIDEISRLHLNNDTKAHSDFKKYIITNSSYGIQILDISYYVLRQYSQLACILKEKTQTGDMYYVFFINQNKINEIVEVRSGMGNTGESYLVADNFEMRSRSRFLENIESGDILVKTPSVMDALRNKKGKGISYDYRGFDVISAYNKLSVPGINWVIISEIDIDEAMAPVYKLRTYMIWIVIFISILLVAITLLLSRLISNPINILKNAILNLSKGKLNFELPLKSSNDEIGKMQEAITILKNNLSATTYFAEEIGNGNFKVNHKPLSEEDSLGYALLVMRDKLIQSNRIQAQLVRQRSAGLIEGQEKERERIARELHDSLGQMLTALRLRISILKEQDSVKNDLKNIIDDTIAEVRRISNNVMPSTLIDFGLESALKSLCENSSRLTEEISVNFIYFHNTFENKSDLSYDIRICLYRIAQEGINNAIKYSMGTQIDMKVIQEDFSIKLTIKDNGIGFDTNIATVGKGLYNMRERARLSDGKCSINSISGSGTEINVEIPLKQL
jgi:two-component system NarL family sensor kinase